MDYEEDVSRIPESDDEDDDFIKIRGNVVGAPLPIPSSRMKSLKEKSESPVLGLSRKPIPPKKLTFNKKH